MTVFIRLFIGIGEKIDAYQKSAKRNNDLLTLANSLKSDENQEIPYHLVDYYLDDINFFKTKYNEDVLFYLMLSRGKKNPVESFKYLSKIIDYHKDVFRDDFQSVHHIMIYGSWIEPLDMVSMIKKIINPLFCYYHLDGMPASCWEMLYACGADVTKTNLQGDNFWQHTIKNGYKLDAKHITFLITLITDGHIASVEDLLIISIKNKHNKLFWHLVESPWTNFKNDYNIEGWFATIIMSSNMSDLMKIMRLLYDHKRLNANFMIIIFDVLYSLRRSYKDLCETITTLIDQFILMNNIKFDFINYRGVDGKTICDRLESIGSPILLPYCIVHILESKNILVEDNSYKCIVCMDQEATATIITCRHSGFCRTCIKTMKKCPVCTQPYTGADTIEFYYS